MAYRFAAKSAIVSGVCGVAAFGCLIASLVMRSWETEEGVFTYLLRSHDVAIVLQSLFLIPLALALDTIYKRASPKPIRITLAVGLGSLTMLVVFVLLGMIKLVADVLYMISQGGVGIWLISVCRQLSNNLPRGLRRLGSVAGFGLILVSTFPIGYYVFVDPAIFHGPLSNDDLPPAGTDRANGIVHLVLAVGTMIGCSTYPTWTALVGRWLLMRERR